MALRAGDAVALFATINFNKMDNGYRKPRLLDAYARTLRADGKKIKAIETFDALLQSDISKEWKAKIEKELDKIAENMN